MRTIEKFLLVSTYILLPLIPVILFVQGAAANLTLLVLVSRAAGIYALVWLSLQFILTSRVKPIEWIVGQDRLIVAHIIAAVAAFALLAVHTGFGGEERGLGVLRWFSGAGLTVIGYVSVFSGLFFSNYFVRFVPFLVPWRDMAAKILKLSYERCLWIHYAMAAGMILLLAHVLLLPGKGLGAFKVSMASITAGGLAFFIWHKFLDPALRLRQPWTVAEVIRESDSVTTLIFEHPGGRRFRHHPGQFCYLHPLGSKVPRQSHPFTVSSNPEDQRPAVTVKNLGDFTSRLQDMEPGDTVSLEGAYGRFSYRHVPAGRELIFIAGGIGITPMLSMLRHLSRKEPSRKSTLIWGVRNAQDLIRLDEIEGFSRDMSNFTFVPVLSRTREGERRTGRIDRELLLDLFNGDNSRNYTPDLENAEIFLCGPPAMVTAVLRALKGLGVKRRRIHTERFSF